MLLRRAPHPVGADVWRCSVCLFPNSESSAAKAVTEITPDAHQASCLSSPSAWLHVQHQKNYLILSTRWLTFQQESSGVAMDFVCPMLLVCVNGMCKCPFRCVLDKEKRQTFSFKQLEEVSKKIARWRSVLVRTPRTLTYLLREPQSIGSKSIPSLEREVLYCTALENVFCLSFNSWHPFPPPMLLNFQGCFKHCGWTRGWWRGPGEVDRFRHE